MPVTTETPESHNPISLADPMRQTAWHATGFTRSSKGDLKS